MNKKNVLTNSAILTAIWDETKKDNLELIKPFVEFLIGENCIVGDKIDNSYIIKQMEEKFSFVEFPETILTKVYGRLKGVVEKKDKEYYLKKDISSACEKFKDRQLKLKEESEKVIIALKEYLKKANTRLKNIDNQGVMALLTIFLEKTGFVTIENVREFETKENYKKDQNNFYIAKFIIEEFEKETVISKYIEKIISGFMLANAIYMQIESSNTETLKKVDIYLDAPLLLNILNLKTNSQNESGNLLMQLLKDKNANIHCFVHNYNEVLSIMESYKNNRKGLKEKTLERWDLEGYTESDVERNINQLKLMLNSRGIEVVETPEYVKKEDEYSGIIDERGLIDFLIENYAYNKEKAEGVIERDVKSIASIERIREGKKCNKIEDCKAVFVTTNYNLVNYTEKCLGNKRYEEIGPLITDVDLITVLWLKSFKSNPDLPKLKLIENARASLELTSTMIKRVKDVIEKMEKEGIINQADIVSGNIQELNYYRKEIMEQIDGDEENINEEVILGVIDKDNIKLKQELDMKKEEIKQILGENQKAQKEKEEIIHNIKENCKRKASSITKCLKMTYLISSGIILLAIFVGSIYVIYVNNMSIQGITIIAFIGLLLDVLGITATFVPKYSKIKKYVFNRIDRLQEKIYLSLIERKKKDFPQLFK